MISVVIPCYNSAGDVGEAIESVLQQTRDDYVQEIIVVDDGSADHSEAVVRRWKDRDNRVRYIYQQNQGPSVARNRGVEEARGKHVGFLDADDLWSSEKLERQVPFLEAHPKVALVCSDYMVEEKERTYRMRARHLDYRQDDLLESLYLRGGPVMMSTVVLRKQIFEDVGGFDPSILKGQDTDLWLRIAAEHPIHHFPDALITKRVREESVSSDMSEKVKYLREITDRFAEKYPRLVPLRDRRHGILSELLARHWILQGDGRKARSEAVRALAKNPRSVRALLLVFLSALPLSKKAMGNILHGLGAVRRTLTGLKTALGKVKAPN